MYSQAVVQAMWPWYATGLETEEELAEDQQVKSPIAVIIPDILDWLCTGMLKDSLTLATQFVDQTFWQQPGCPHLPLSGK